jgi:hypothetical protein
MDVFWNSRLVRGALSGHAQVICFGPCEFLIVDATPKRDAVSCPRETQFLAVTKCLYRIPEASLGDLGFPAVGSIREGDRSVGLRHSQSVTREPLGVQIRSECRGIGSSPASAVELGALLDRE